MVGFGESYEENATREIEEEMGIDLSEENPYRNRMNRLFQFSFEDDRVKVTVPLRTASQGRASLAPGADLGPAGIVG